VLRVSDDTGIPFVKLLEGLWGISASRLADELARLGLDRPTDTRLAALSDAERAEVSDFVDFLASRHRKARPWPRLTSARS
jgi:hypothetical protein